MNYYFVYGPKMEDVVTTYTHLTGKPELPPMWAVGYQQCKWSYYPESKVTLFMSSHTVETYLSILTAVIFLVPLVSSRYFNFPKRG